MYVLNNAVEQKQAVKEKKKGSNLIFFPGRVKPSQSKLSDHRTKAADGCEEDEIRRFFYLIKTWNATLMGLELSNEGQSHL